MATAWLTEHLAGAGIIAVMVTQDEGNRAKALAEKTYVTSRMHALSRGLCIQPSSLILIAVCLPGDFGSPKCVRMSTGWPRPTRNWRTFWPTRMPRATS